MADAPVEVEGRAGVREPEVDLGFLRADRDDLVERPIERRRPVEREETRLQERGLPAPVETVDDRHTGAERDVRVLVALEVPEAEAIDPHR